jgi:hypothetical protein
MTAYLHNKIVVENDQIDTIIIQFEKYYKLIQDICNKPIGAYSINTILESVEEILNYLEIYTPIIRKWVHTYLETHRGEIWLHHGINKGNYLTDYWKINETDMEVLRNIWPFLFDSRKDPYKGFIIDLEGAQHEVLRQRKRQENPNPNYTPFHPDGCSDGCSCWMLDDMEQWYTEEQEEIKNSRNIFFNTSLQREFFKEVCNDIQMYRFEWMDYTPEKNTKFISKEFKIEPGLTPIKIVINWVKNDFYYSSLLSIFHWSDKFKETWENIELFDDFINYERKKLKEICDLI